MIGELLCPDCGGVVGATETTEAGPPCRCFVSDRRKTEATEGEKPEDTVSDAPSVQEAPSSSKVCRMCGKDVTGQKRFRDHLGYYCLECARELEKQERQGRVRCRVCGHLVKEESLSVYEGTKMCPGCRAERVELQKAHIKQIGFRGARTREELRNIIILAIVALALLLVMIYGAWRVTRH